MPESLAFIVKKYRAKKYYTGNNHTNEGFFKIPWNNINTKNPHNLNTNIPCKIVKLKKVINYFFMRSNKSSQSSYFFLHFFQFAPNKYPTTFVNSHLSLQNHNIFWNKWKKNHFNNLFKNWANITWNTL